MRKTARPVSEKVKKGIFYQMFLRAFTSEGTIEAATKMLPEIAELGVTHIYICPITEADDDMRKEFWSDRQIKSGFENPKNPYRMKDYFKIDSEYGNDNDFNEFVKCAHSLNMYVLMDLVYLHCGPSATLISEHPDFVLHDENGQIKNMSWHFPGLNFENKELREFLLSNMEYFIKKFDIDGYRCDVGDNVPLDFWIEGRKRIEKIKPDIVMLNEGINPDYVVEGFDLMYSFTLAERLVNALSGKGAVTEMRKEWEHRNSICPENARAIRYMDNHDTASDSYNDRFEKAFKAGGMEAGLVCIYTLDGVPLIYNGNEVCDDARHSIWSNRYFGKLYINWENALTKNGENRRKLLKELATMRKSHNALTDGSLRWFDNSAPDEVISYIREAENEKIAVMINTSANEKNIELSFDIKAEILKSGAQVFGQNVALSPKGYLVCTI